MQYYGAKKLAESFRTVRNNTIQTAEEIPESHYGFKAADGIRTVEKLLTHIALGYRFQYLVQATDKRSNFDGFNFPVLWAEFGVEEAKPRTKAEVIALLRERGEIWAKFVEGVSEEFLAEPFAMLPGAVSDTKSRFEMLLSVKEHEMHHRGQLMLIQRMLGIVPHLTRALQTRLAQAPPPPAGKA